jgi:hypothetical protein
MIIHFKKWSICGTVDASFNVTPIAMNNGIIRGVTHDSNFYCLCIDVF